ncbi:MAG: anthranilate phosphoribosyltransferase [Candidatus Omnitrophica bacterium]|nr:anthranilate phosphoribosyltransferase [Candidatus Omnitrophota bacterium]
MIKEAIDELTRGKNISFGGVKEVFEEIFDSRATASQIAAFLTSLKIKGESEEEISAAAAVVRERARKVNVREGFLGIKDKDEPVMDTCGTGGSGLNKFNISTAVSFIVSAAGIKVAKHGNRAMSSTCGSADVMEALGVNVEVPASVMEKAIKKTGIGFLYAPLYHPALGKVARIRKEMGVRTIFNILGPLCNPASANYQLLGVYSPGLTTLLARVLRRLEVKKAFVVYGKDVRDEVSLTGPTQVSFLNNKRISDLTLTPSSFGLKKVRLGDLLVKDAKMSAKVIKDVLGGKSGAPRDIVLANAAACFYILGKVANLKQGTGAAAELIDSKKAKRKLLEFKGFLEKNA